MPLAPGDRLGAYEILALIGAGGMGELYRAEDVKLGREVAIKVLPAATAQDPQRLARFHREARAVAALNHPHIVSLYSIEQANGVHFLTMELVDGRSLKELIPPEGMEPERVIVMATALADAIAAAHEKGLIHRDLKPANIMVTRDGRVKVLDFGLAKEIRTVGPEDTTVTSFDQTQAGVVMGTPSYMSPEQIAGRRVDHRSDLFSLGIIFYEMLTGTKPFQGKSGMELAASILRDPIPPMIKPGVPAEFVKLIEQCLAKGVGERIQTARALLDRLRSAGQSGKYAIRRGVGDDAFWVAVLPFNCAGANPELMALAEGMTEDIVTGLSRFSYLRVSALSSTLRYSQEAVDVRSAAKKLGARYVMTGSLRRAGSRLRIAVQLVDVISGVHLWAETYERTLRPEALFELQDDLVPRIVSTTADTHGILPHTMTEAVRDRDPAQLSPYEAVLRSFAHFLRVNAEEHAAARAALERAVELAPGNADCWAMLSLIIKEEYMHGFNLRPDALRRAFSAARRAVEIAPSNHFAYHALAATLFFQREIQSFRGAAERAIALNPMDGFTIAYLGFLIAYAGDWERGCTLNERARSLNPHHPGWYWFVPFFDAYRKSDYHNALEMASKINMPGFWRTQMALAAVHGQLGEGHPAANALRALLTIKPDFATVARTELGKWWEPDLVEHLIDGLRKAGLEIGR